MTEVLNSPCAASRGRQICRVGDGDSEEVGLVRLEAIGVGYATYCRAAAADVRE